VRSENQRIVGLHRALTLLARRVDGQASAFIADYVDWRVTTTVHTSAGRPVRVTDEDRRKEVRQDVLLKLLQKPEIAEKAQEDDPAADAIIDGYISVMIAHRLIDCAKRGTTEEIDDGTSLQDTAREHEDEWLSLRLDLLEAVVAFHLSGVAR